MNTYRKPRRGRQYTACDPYFSDGRRRRMPRRSHGQGRYRPDVIFRMHGLRVVIEGKFADHPSAAKVVLNDAKNRLQAGIAHIAMAAIYPRPLRTTATAKIADRLEHSQIKYRILSAAYESEDWFSGNPATLLSALRRAHEALTKDDVVERTAKALSIQFTGGS